MKKWKTKNQKSVQCKCSSSVVYTHSLAFHSGKARECVMILHCKGSNYRYQECYICIECILSTLFYSVSAKLYMYIDTALRLFLP